MKARVRDIEVEYRLEGPADAPVVMASHSLAADLGMWEPQRPALGAFRLLRYDSRGHGGTTATAGAYHFDQLADDALGLLDALGIAEVHFVGLSMGGMVGMSLGIRHPQRLKSLVLADTMCEVDDAYRRLCDERIRNARANGMGPLVEPTIARWFTPPTVAANPAILDEIRGAIARTPVDGYVGCNEALKTLDYRGRLGSIRLPSLVIVGEDDPSTPVAASRVIVDGIPGAQLVVVPQAAHLANVERPDAFNAALASFLGRQ
jgi:3-oxoadipate enol-lactonase